MFCQDAAGGEPSDLLIVAVGDRQVDARAAVGGRAEEEAFLGDPHAPRVVVRVPEKLELRAIGLEPVEPLAELVPLAADRPVEPGVTDDPVEPVIEAIAEVARPGVGVAGAPAGEENLADVGLVVAVGVLEEQGVGRLVDDQAAVGEGHAGGDAQLVGEDGELVGLAVAVGVLADLDLVVPFAALLEVVGIVDGLGDPEPAFVIPGHRDRLGDLGLGDEQARLPAPWAWPCA